MPEWLIEDGIGEQRAVRLTGGAISEARVSWQRELAAGAVEDAVLITRAASASRGVARFASGAQALVDRLPPSASEGAPLRLEVLRPAILEQGRGKLAQARITDRAVGPAPTLAQSLADEGHQIRVVSQFPGNEWDELVGEAFAAQVDFPGGSLHFSPTPAMTLIDVDGTLPARALALAAVPALAAALRRFDIGGSVGIDFPTLPDKRERQAVDVALAAGLAGWAHERTAMNGFGFVQLVSRRSRVSLLERATFNRAGMAWRLLLRRAEQLQGPGDLELTLNPSLRRCAGEADLAELMRRTGRRATVRESDGLALTAPHAQLVPR